jgi:hypothetical protein
MAGSTIEQLKALKVLTRPASAATARPTGDAEQYAGQYVAYADEWTGDEVRREIVCAAADPERVLGGSPRCRRRRSRPAD